MSAWQASLVSLGLAWSGMLALALTTLNPERADKKAVCLAVKMDA